MFLSSTINCPFSTKYSTSQFDESQIAGMELSVYRKNLMICEMNSSASKQTRSVNTAEISNKKAKINRFLTCLHTSTFPVIRSISKVRRRRHSGKQLRGKRALHPQKDKSCDEALNPRKLCEARERDQGREGTFGHNYALSSSLFPPQLFSFCRNEHTSPREPLNENDSLSEHFHPKFTSAG